MDPNSPPSPCNSSMQNTESCAKVAVWTHRNRTEGLKENIGTFWASLESFCFRHVYPPSFEVNVCLQSSIWSIECLANYWTKRNHMRCFHKAPSYDYIKVFSTLCFAHNKKTKDKFAPRGRRCLFVGYPFGQKGWKPYVFRDRRILCEPRHHLPREHLSLCNHGGTQWTSQSFTICWTFSCLTWLRPPLAAFGDNNWSWAAHDRCKGELTVSLVEASTSTELGQP